MVCGSSARGVILFFYFFPFIAFISNLIINNCINSKHKKYCEQMW